MTGLSIALAVMLLLILRGTHLGRPLTVTHAMAAGGALIVALVAHALGWNSAALVTVSLAGALLMLPESSRPDPQLLPTIANLVDQTSGDPLAPFSMHSTKSYFLESSGRAAIGYRTRVGIAVVGGDPIGDTEAFETAAGQFSAFCRSRGWRVAVLGASAAGRRYWSKPLTGIKLHSVAFGRDVVLDVPAFNLTGRRFRNLRQAVSRTHNAGVTTEIVSEVDLPAALRAELQRITAGSRSGNRGFSMILDHLLDGRTPGLLLVVARDRAGEVVGFQRYATADHGREISLDLPWRRPDAPNGLDERMTMAMLDWARNHQGLRLSLALAAFPDLFDKHQRNVLDRTAFRLIHLGDPLIAVESLYAYLRKYHSLGGRRYAMVGLSSAALAIFAFLTLEFVPHRREQKISHRS